jgi:CDP-diglyceride synthetase
MCCFWTVLAFLGPRIASVIWWIVEPSRWVGTAFSNALWPILGILFLPWATLMYVLVSPGGVDGWDWLWLGLAFLGDIGAYAGGGVGNRDRLGR